MATSKSHSSILCALPSPDTGDSDAGAKKFDALLNSNDDGQFHAAVQLLESQPGLVITKERFVRIFEAIEEMTKSVEQNAINTRMEQELPRSRVEMTNMYNALKGAGHLKLFGSINRNNMPVSGSHTVRPSIMEQITLLSMKSLTPKPSNTLLYAGIVVATLEVGSFLTKVCRQLQVHSFHLAHFFCCCH